MTEFWIAFALLVAVSAAAWAIVAHLERAKVSPEEEEANDRREGYADGMAGKCDGPVRSVAYHQAAIDGAMDAMRLESGKRNKRGYYREDYSPWATGAFPPTDGDA